MHPLLKACGVKCARWVASKSETHLWNSLGKSSLLRSSAVKKHGNLLIFPWVTPSPGENLPGDHTQTHTHIQPSSQSSALLFATQEQRIIRHEGFFQLKSDLLGVDVFFWNHYCSSPYSERSRCMMYLTSALGWVASSIHLFLKWIWHLCIARWIPSLHSATFLIYVAVTVILPLQHPHSFPSSFLSFITLILKASAIGHSFPSMWSFLLYSASWYNSLQSSPWNLCFSTILCFSAYFLWHNVSQFPIFLHTDSCSLSFPYPLFTPLFSPGQWLAASVEFHSLGNTYVSCPSFACTAGSSTAINIAITLFTFQPASSQVLVGRSSWTEGALLEWYFTDVNCHVRKENRPWNARSDILQSVHLPGIHQVFFYVSHCSPDQAQEYPLHVPSCWPSTWLLKAFSPAAAECRSPFITLYPPQRGSMQGS